VAWAHLGVGPGGNRKRGLSPIRRLVARLLRYEAPEQAEAERLTSNTNRMIAPRKSVA